MKFIKRFVQYLKENDSEDRTWALYYLVPGWENSYGGLCIKMYPYRGNSKKYFPDPEYRGDSWAYFTGEIKYIDAEVEARCGPEPDDDSEDYEDWDECRNEIFDGAYAEAMEKLSKEYGQSDLYGKVFLIGFKEEEPSDSGDCFESWGLGEQKFPNTEEYLANLETERVVLLGSYDFGPEGENDNLEYDEIPVSIEHLVSILRKDTKSYGLASLIRTKLPEIAERIRNEYPDLDLDVLAQAGDWGF